MNPVTVEQVGFTAADALAATAGGILIGLASAAVLIFNRRICGISGIVAGLLHARGHNTVWRGLFVVGLLLGGLVLEVLAAGTIANPEGTGLGRVVVAGVLVGVGTRMGNGCTSGHGVCGLGRLSKRSLVATLTFIAVAILVVLSRAQLAEALGA